MPAPIHRTRLGEQVAAAVRTELERGTWQDHLPGERVLSRHLGVSRPILREGLARLRTDGLIAVTARLGYRITLPQGKSPANRSKEIQVLSPAPVMNLRPFTHLWLEELRQSLHEAGHRLVLHHGARYFTKRPAHALSQLVRDHPAAGWILIHASRETQQWFSTQKLPALVAGSVHPGLPLASVRLDVEAVSRHAANRLVRLGHRRIAFLNLSADRAGDLESEHAFIEVARAAGIDAQIVHHDTRAESVERAVQRLVARQPRVTGWLIGHAQTYLSVLGALCRLGLRTPEDISLISREDDPFLSALLPAPARYVANPRRYASRLHRALLAVCAGQRVPSASSLLPELVAGGSMRPFTS